MNLVGLAELSVDFIRNRVGELESTALETACIDDLKLLLSTLFYAYVSPTIRIAEGKALFRVRKHPADKQATMLTSVDEIFPQAAYTKRLGRANRTGKPIYYFSSSSGTALNEVKAIAGDTCTIIECRPRQHASPLLIPIGIHEMAKRQNVLIGGGLPEPPVRIRASLTSDEEFCKYEIINNFVKAQFLRAVDDQHDYQYKLSIAIAELALEFQTDESLVDGIAYPSIASEEIGANLAILPLAFHRIYQPTACCWVKIAGTLPNGGFSLSASGRARQISDLGQIIW